MKKLIRIIRTDLIKAKILNSEIELSYIYFIYLLFRSKTARIHTAIRMRSSNKLLSLISRLYLHKFFIEVGDNAQIGRYFFLPHPRCIIIANDVIIGSDVNIGQYATIGGNFKKTKKIDYKNMQKLPIIGDNVVIAAGAVIGGPVTIGNHVIVGANSVVTKDIPNNKIVTGNNIISKRNIEVATYCGEYKYID
jgi:serine O-acetyltransferase